MKAIERNAGGAGINSREDGDTGERRALELFREHRKELRDRTGVAVSSRSSEVRTKILKAAKCVFEEHGAIGLSLRKVAEGADVAVGNLTYHFPTKSILIEEMFRHSLSYFVERFTQNIDIERQSATDILLALSDFYVLLAREDPRFFLQLWGYVATGPEARELVRTLFQPIGKFALRLVRAANPALSFEEARRATLHLFSLKEGLTLFIALGPDDDIALAAVEADIRKHALEIVGLA